MTNKETADEETTSKTFHTKSPTNNITSDNPRASQITGPLDRISQHNEQEKNTEHSYVNNQPPLDSDTVPHGTNTTLNHQAPHCAGETDSIARSTEFSLKNDQLFHPEEQHKKAQHSKYDTPCNTSPATSEVFTYYNCATTNNLRNKSPTLSSFSDKYSHDDLQRESVFISRNQTTSPHRRGTKRGKNGL